MIAKVFLALTSCAPWLKRAAWRWWYQRLAGNYRGQDWKFMNYGYEPESKSTLTLSAEDESDRLFIQLYAKALEGVDTHGKTLLEVGSGRGGGASFVARYLAPQAVTGMDYSANAVQLSERLHKAPNLVYRCGSAEEIPFGDGTFDIVYNVESSHCYGDTAKFFSEAHRVLKPAGFFCWVDFRSPKLMEEEHQRMRNAGFEMASDEEITPCVVRALDLIHGRKMEVISQKVPGFLRNSFAQFAGVQGSEIYELLKKRELVYHATRCRKRS